MVILQNVKKFNIVIFITKIIIGMMDVLNVYMGSHGWLHGIQLLRNLLLIGIVVYQVEMIHTVWLINKSNKIMFNVCFVRMGIF